MTPAQLQGWTNAAVALAPVVEGGIAAVEGIFKSFHAPTMTPAEVAAAWDTIENTDVVRSAIAAQEAGDTPSTN